MDNFKQIQQQAEAQINAMGEAMLLANQAINALPNNIKSLIPNAQMDIEAMKKGVVNGDASGLTDLLKKYSKDAGTTTK